MAARPGNRLSIENRHVDDHALWIDPRNGRSSLYRRGRRGLSRAGIVVRQLAPCPPICRWFSSTVATPDNDVTILQCLCGGTQDNFTQCGPSAARAYTDGITNADWWLAKFGDGFKAQIDPSNANIVYAQSQIWQPGAVRSGDRRAPVDQTAARRADENNLQVELERSAADLTARQPAASTSVRRTPFPQLTIVVKAGWL